MQIVSVFRINYDIFSFRSDHKLVWIRNAKLCSTLHSPKTRSISEIMQFSIKLWMRSSSFHRQGALLIVLAYGILIASRKYVFDIFAQGGAVNSSQWRILIGDIIFIKLITRNSISIIRRFRDNDAFLQTDIDVMVINPLGGAVRSL